MCEGVKFEITEAPMMMGTCHCTRCQRYTGSSGMTAIAVPPGSVTLTQGEELITEYELEDGGTRHFCSRCGSPTYGSDEKFVIVPAGALQEDPELRPQFHMMVDFKADWDEIHDALPQFGEYPPTD